MTKWPKKETKAQTIGEEIANAVSHCVMAVFALVATILLLVKQSDGWELTASLVFGFGMIMLYLMSTLYHALSFTKSKGVFKRFDHISIYFLIGGTFAPALLLLPALKTDHFLGIDFMPSTGVMLFIIQWVLILIGTVVKAIWIYKGNAVHTVIYLALGWSSLIFVGKLYAFSIPAFWLILGGGIAYSIGVYFYAQPKKKYFHFIWHIFVGLGTILQFFAIYLYLL
ncbi:Integral membrane protein, hemolysin-III related [Alteracholeplasma palmae J233]|uniref:Integral membrane protein, hemolysin-III related n=1 Tax=Alteracholeplasma palmae (strain ATCC 49389 / J233) TaxID=1318466 RepID=U4KLE1_ALTPJ|nr:hemolysin III family protein [Alteracholeplasma palmae]CCV64637.1 Integral membrane protein, hemolysin-III related [Alteracholeplasma palmae J233]